MTHEQVASRLDRVRNALDGYASNWLALMDEPGAAYDIQKVMLDTERQMASLRQEETMLLGHLWLLDRQ